MTPLRYLADPKISVRLSDTSLDTQPEDCVPRANNTSSAGAGLNVFAHAKSPAWNWQNVRLEKYRAIPILWAEAWDFPPTTESWWASSPKGEIA
jgi:hypothetical protein